MDDSRRQPWLRPATLVGMLYFAVAIASIELAGATASNQMRFFWRFSAFVVSSVVLMIHIAYEHFRRHSTARATAWHASVAVALGGLLLAMMANIHDLASASGYRPGLLIALVVWPLLTGVPAFIVALIAAAGLDMKHRNES